MTSMTVGPDLRRRRIPARVLHDDAAEEAREARLHTLSAYRDVRGWCLVVDGVPFRPRSAFATDHAGEGIPWL